MDDFLEFEADKKTIRTISLEEFSVEDLHQYIKELKKEIERIEKHNLDDMRFLYWRNSKLDFSDPESLINSLEKKSGDRNLHKISESIDENILKYLIRDKKIKSFDKFKQL